MVFRLFTLVFTYLCLMENHYLAFRALRRQVEQLLKQDDIESALLHIFNFIEANESLIESNIPQSKAIAISASVARLKQAFINGLIAWESTYRVRTDLIEECLILLEYLRREVEEDTVERRNMPHISGFPHLFVVKDSLERIESLLLPYVKSVS